MDIPDNQIHKTGNLPDKLKVCVVARIMFTANINTLDALINRSTGKIEYMQIPRAKNNLIVIVCQV